MSVIARVPALAPFRIRSFRFQWPADLLASVSNSLESARRRAAPGKTAGNAAPDP